MVLQVESTDIFFPPHLLWGVLFMFCMVYCHYWYLYPTEVAQVVQFLDSQKYVPLLGLLCHPAQHMEESPGDGQLLDSVLGPYQCDQYLVLQVETE